MNAPSELQGHEALSLVRRKPVAENHEIDSMYRIAEAASKSTMIAASNPFDIFMVIGFGRELGFGEFTALKFIHLIPSKGKVTMAISGTGMLALCNSSPLCEDFFVENTFDDKGDVIGAIATTKRVGRENRTMPYTLVDAGKSGLFPASSPHSAWAKYTPNMLRWRAVTSLAQIVYPDLLGGLYTIEEITDDKTVIDQDGNLIQGVSAPSKPTPQKKAEKVVEPDFQQPKDETVIENPVVVEEPITVSDGTWLREKHEADLRVFAINYKLELASGFTDFKEGATSWTDVAKDFVDWESFKAHLIEVAGIKADPVVEPPADAPATKSGLGGPPRTHVDKPFDMEVPVDLPAMWKEGAIEMSNAIAGRYFGEEIAGVIELEMDGHLSFRQPTDWWYRLTATAIDGGVPIKAKVFKIEKFGTGYLIKTDGAAIEAVSYSRKAFAGMLPDGMTTSIDNVTEWKVSETDLANFMNLDKDVLITVELKARKADASIYFSIKKMELVD